MTNQEIKNKVEFFTNIYLSIITKALKTNRDPIKCGKLGLEIAGCPKDVAQEIQRLMFKAINKTC